MDTESMKEYVRDIPDYPKKGIIFRDITPMINDGEAFSSVVDELAERIDMPVDYVAGIEARGFIFAGALAHKLGVGFIPIRKKGKLPFDKIKEDYDLEYGSESIEIHTDSLAKGKNVVIVDDLLATGGTAKAAASLIRRLNGTVSALAFIIELTDLKGRDNLQNTKVISLLKY